MRHIPHIILSVFFLVTGLFLHAGKISENQAKTVAINWINTHGNSFIDSTHIHDIRPIVKQGDTALFIIRFIPAGWAMVSATDVAEPVIGYSTKSVMDYHNMPSQFEAWINGVAEEITSGMQPGYQPAPGIDEKWSYLRSRILTKPELKSAASVTVGPLLSTNWNQGRYYNELAPFDASSSAGNNHAWIGCVATAMAQIMKYWEFPITGRGSHSYNHPSYGVQAAYFENETYTWAAMPNNLTEENFEVQKISYHAAVAVNMSFSPTGSGAYLSDALNGMVEYFKYNSAMFESSKDRWGDGDWKALIRSDLNRGRPILYSGYNPSYTSGHAWVCDGYSGEFFHFNWGWGGTANGNYLLSALTPGGYNYTNAQAALFGIVPVQPAQIAYPYWEGFETGTEGKTKLCGVAELSTQEKHSGTYSVKLSREDLTTRSNNSVSLTFIVPENAQLSFRVKRSTPTVSSLNTQWAKIYTEFGTNIIATLFEGDYNDTEWINYSIDLKNYQGQTLRLVIMQENRDFAKAQWMYIDNISITGVNQNLSPFTPSNPNPANTASGVSRIPNLRWSGGDPNGDDLIYSVYLSPTNPPTLKASVFDENYTPAELGIKTTYYWKIVASDGTLTSESGIWSFTTQGVPPVMETCGASNITSTSAQVCGMLLDSKGANITSKGVAWSTNPIPGLNENLSPDGTQLNPYQVTITGLKPYQTYNARAYALSDEGSGLGSVVSFRTLADNPVVDLKTVFNIQRNSAWITGSTIAVNDLAITERGVVWSKIKDFDPETAFKVLETGTWSETGNFDIQITNLHGPATIYYRTYLKNSVGTAYSIQGQFETQNSIPIIDLDADNSSQMQGNKFRNTCYEQQPGCQIADTDVLLEDADGDTIHKITITLFNPVNPQKEHIAYEQANTNVVITGNYTRELTLTRNGSLTNADWQQILQNVDYRNDMDAPVPAIVRQVSVSINDGIANGIAAVTYINVVAVNDAPVCTQLPAIQNEPSVGGIAVAIGGVWSDILDGCTGSITKSMQWQVSTGGEAPNDAMDIPGETSVNLTIDESYCGKKIRIKEMVLDNRCGGNNDATAEEHSAWYEIKKKVQSIQFDNIPTLPYSRTPYILKSTATSGLPVHYTLAVTSIASVSNDTLYLQDIGRTLVNCHQPGNACYAQATSISRVLTIEPGTQEIQFEVPEPTPFDKQFVKLNVLSSEGLPVLLSSSNEGIATISGDTVELKGAGSASITASQPGNTRTAAATPITRTLEITKGNQKLLSFSPSTLVYGSGNTTLLAQTNSDLPLEYTSSNPSILEFTGSTMVVIGAGECAITIKSAGNGNWNPLDTSVFVTVKKGTQKIIFAIPEGKRFGDEPFTIETISNAGLTPTLAVVDNNVVKIDNNVIKITGVGTTTLTATQAGDHNWEAIIDTTTLTISKGLQTISFDALPKVDYGTNSITAQATSSSGLEVVLESSAPEVATIHNYEVQIVGAGETTITARQSGNHLWEAATPVSRQLLVNKATQSIIWGLPDSVTTDIRWLPASASATSGLPVKVLSHTPDIAQVLGDSIFLLDKGEAVFIALQEGNQNFAATEQTFKTMVVSGLKSNTIRNGFVEIFPNPAKDYLFVRIDKNVKYPASITIRNLLGEKILERKLQDTIQKIEIDGIRTGLYFIILQTENQAFSEKIVVK